MTSLDPVPKLPSDDGVAPRLSATAVLIGFAIGNGASYAALYLSALAFFWVMALQGVPPQELYPRAYQSNGYLAFAHCLAFVTVSIGGYWCARIARRSALVNAGLAGFLLSVFAFAQMMLPYDTTAIPGWSRALSLLLPVPAFLCGALIRQKHA